MGVSLGQARHFTFQNPVTKEEHSVLQALGMSAGHTTVSQN